MPKTSVTTQIQYTRSAIVRENLQQYARLLVNSERYMRDVHQILYATRRVQPQPLLPIYTHLPKRAICHETNSDLRLPVPDVDPTLTLAAVVLPVYNRLLQ